MVRDILQPERDVVRRAYGDDPDGGDFSVPSYRAEVSPRDLLDRFRRWRSPRDGEADGIDPDAGDARPDGGAQPLPT